MLGVQGSMDLACMDELIDHSWCRVPRLGEAKKPGPPVRFDDEEVDDFDSVDMQPHPGDEEWHPETDEEDFDLPPHDDDELQPDRRGIDAWLKEHSSAEFVAVSDAKRTKKYKFEGGKPGWVFKRSDLGLGYHRDRGGARRHGVPCQNGAAIR